MAFIFGLTQPQFVATFFALPELEKKIKKIKIGITYWYGNSSNYGQKKFQKRHFLLIGTILQPN